MLEWVVRVIPNVFTIKLAEHKIPLRIVKDIKHAVNGAGGDCWMLQRVYMKRARVY